MNVIRAMALCGLLMPLSVQAWEWPWEEQREVRHGYCKGFVVGGLAAFPVQDLSRTQLWLAWNYLNRDAEMIPTDDYSTGRGEFDQLLASGDTTQLLDIANGECALGRN